MLILTYGLAQGSLFLAQSWVVAQGELAFLGEFGSAFTFAIFALYIVDWGGQLVLARRELSEKDAVNRARFFWAFVLARLLIAIPLATAAVAGWALGGSSFWGVYALWFAPALIINTLNASGTLDGMGRSGIGGGCNMLPPLLSACAIPIALAAGEPMRPVILGSAMAIGAVAMVVLQHISLALLGKAIRWARPNSGELVATFREGGVMMIALLPSYAFYRIQVAISLALLGATPTALFIYAKQVVNGFMQVVNFARRAEITRISEAIRVGADVKDILRAQQLGMYFSLGFALILAAGGITVSYLVTQDDFAAAGLIAASFAGAVLLSSLYAAFHQSHVLAYRTGLAAMLANVGFVFGIVLTGVAVWTLGLWGLVLGETLMAGFLAIAAIAKWPRCFRSETTA